MLSLEAAIVMECGDDHLVFHGQCIHLFILFFILWVSDQSR